MIVMAGPCMMESEAHAFEMAQALKEISQRCDIPLIFKTSFDKANRTSVHSPRGVSLDVALGVFSRIRTQLHLPVVTDVHLPDQCAVLAPYVDVLQIPAFLCRQTDLLVAAAQTSCAINIKKGQFLSPEDMGYVAQKVAHAGGKKIMLCERGTFFGYNALVNDMRSLPLMRSTHCPVIFDGTHSVQQPGKGQGKSGGRREFVEGLVRAAIAMGIDGLFLETHPDPDQAPSDGPNMIPLKYLESMLQTFKHLDQWSKSTPYADFSLA